MVYHPRVQELMFILVYIALRNYTMDRLLFLLIVSNIAIYTTETQCSQRLKKCDIFHMIINVKLKGIFREYYYK